MITMSAIFGHHNDNVKHGGAATTGQLTTFVAQRSRVCGVNSRVEEVIYDMYKNKADTDWRQLLLFL